MDADQARAPGLRERKKRRTRRAIQHHALRLFAEQGYEGTTVEQIAAAADVSPSTFFRYYPSKEDVIVSDDYDPMIRDAVLARPAEETPLQAMHNALREQLPPVLAVEGDDIRQRLRLVLSIPALRGRVIKNTTESVATLAGALATRAGRDEPGFGDRVIAAAYTGVLVAAIMDWIVGDATDPAALLDAAYEALRGQLRP